MQKQYSQNVTTQQFSEVSSDYERKNCYCHAVLQVRLVLKLHQFEEFSICQNSQNLPLPLGQPGGPDEGVPLTTADEH